MSHISACSQPQTVNDNSDMWFDVLHVMIALVDENHDWSNLQLDCSDWTKFKVG